MQEYDREYYQKNKDKRREHDREYYQNNKEKKLEYGRKYYQNNKERVKERNQEYNRKYREKMENKQASLQSVYPKERNVHPDNEENSFVNTQNDAFGNKGKLPIFYEEDIQYEENLSNQADEEFNKDKTEISVDEQNQTLVEEPNKIRENYMNQIDLNEENYPFDLNEKPEGIDENVC
ncbi:unnamed protein product [Meloidogyne enterolobii]|uniref:Uncharacterized protein n=1 Tax=Meloidogyne enterolobii TaxID=390850 RepID=A0ACB1ARS5_MELEN